jgi:parvulin-like peptidyl-prolyl isomerase
MADPRPHAEPPHDHDEPMTIRSRPVLDRKHRPRWQDELRTQQLTIVGFAVAISVALGIFGAAAWNGYWETHLRPVASVAGQTFTRGDLDARERIITAETVAEATELSDQVGVGPRDQVLQQEIDSLSQRLQSLSSVASESLVDGAILDHRAGDFEVAVSDEEVDAEIASRLSLPERVRARLVLVESLPDDAEADAEPTDEQLAGAREAAQAVLDRIEEGEDFATLATEVSDDFTAATGGELGWFGDADVAYDAYFDPLADAEVGDLVGPVETDRGFAILELLDRRDATAEGDLGELLAAQGVPDAAYRDHVRQGLLLEAFRSHFGDEVIVTPTAQRRVAEIVIRPVAEEVVPQERARHVLVQPDPELDSQEEATDEQWDAALAEAEEVRELVTAEDADWFEIADEYSDDTGSGAQGGDLGWYDPAASPFVGAFTDALADLEIGDVSEPIRTEFGWHVVQKTGERDSPQEQAADVVEQLRADPDAFAETASRISENAETAQAGGEVGWVARYQLDAAREEAVFGLTEEGEISDPVDDTTTGITIYQLLETSESREIEDDRLEQIRTTGFDRWLEDEVRSGVDTWLDPQFTSTTTG